MGTIAIELLSVAIGSLDARVNLGLKVLVSWDDSDLLAICQVLLGRSDLLGPCLFSSQLVVEVSGE